MKEKLISFETARLAKEKRFYMPCEDFYIEYVDDNVIDLFNYEEQRGSGFAELYRNNKDFIFSAPTQSLLQKWLREKRIDITVITDWKKGNRIYYVGFSFVNTKNQIDIWFSKDNKNKIEYSNYEDALEVGLYECLQKIS